MKIFIQPTPTLTEYHFQFDPSFGPYLNTLTQKREEASDTNAIFYRHLIKKFQQEPALLVPFKNVQVLEEHEELIELLQMSLLPLSANSQNFCMALAFLQPNCLFYYTPSFKRIFIDAHVEFDTKEDEVGHLRYFIKLILERCYQVETVETPQPIKQVYNAETHTIRYYELNIESRFIHVYPNGALPPLNDEWQSMLYMNDDDFMTVFAKFPSHKFRLEGFCMIVTEDVSKSIAINHLKNAVLDMHASHLEETFGLAEAAVGELFNDSRMKIGITPFFKINGKVVYDRSYVTKCVGISSAENRVQHGISIQDIYNKFAENSKPYIFSSINKEFLSTRKYLSGLLENDIKSFMVYPIKTRDGLMGIFELGSPEDGFITSKTMDVLKPVVPLITDILYYMIEMFDNKIDRLVKEKFTPLQKSVEWKFNEVAWEYLVHEGQANGDESISSVVFKEVYPLYGAVDIRDSSIKRNAAVRNDYVVQLNATVNVLNEIYKHVSTPLVESMQLKCADYLASLHDVLTAEDEMHISEFTSEAVSFFQSISSGYPRFSEAISRYIQMTDGETGEFHNQHIAYEKSFQKINKKIESYLEEEVSRLQKTYPFYFEKYRTDGVEYNIYIGQSVCPDQNFDPEYLKNLRLWQLTAMANVALANNKMRNNQPVPLQTTQLILVHGYPIDISFRKDERRFDVEGSYNIRYEMLKKRIDKVRIKDTLERLTQPDKIAIVYSNAADAEEYLTHIYLLQSKGLLAADVEMLELENLQGVIGLKALRVGIF